MMKIGGGDFLLPAEEKQLKEMLKRHGKAFTFQPEEIGCVDPKIVEPMVIYSLSLIFRGILSQYPCLGLESLNF